MDNLNTYAETRRSHLGRCAGTIRNPLRMGSLLQPVESYWPAKIATDLSLKGFFASGRQSALANGPSGRTQERTGRPQGLYICGPLFNPGGEGARLMYRLPRKPALMCKGDFVVTNAGVILASRPRAKAKNAINPAKCVALAGRYLKVSFADRLAVYRRTRKESHPRYAGNKVFIWH